MLGKKLSKLNGHPEITLYQAKVKIITVVREPHVLWESKLKVVILCCSKKKTLTCFIPIEKKNEEAKRPAGKVQKRYFHKNLNGFS